MAEKVSWLQWYAMVAAELCVGRCMFDVLVLATTRHDTQPLRHLWSLEPTECVHVSPISEPSVQLAIANRLVGRDFPCG